MSAAPVRVCHVGCGHWGVNLLRNLGASARARVVAITDTDEAARAGAAARHPGARTYARLEDALADEAVEAVVLATPSGLHDSQALAVLDAGRHVLVEKPMANTVRAAEALVAAAARTGLVLMVGHTFLYNNLVRAVKDTIDEGALGEVFYAYSQRLNLGRFRRDSDVLWTLAPHDISILNYWFDARPSRVSARGDAFIHRASGRAEVCFAKLDYPGGVSAHLHLSWLDPQKRREMVVVGARRMLIYDDMNADAHIRLYDKSAQAEHQRDATDFADFTTRVRAGEVVVPAIRLKEPLAAEIDEFLRCVQTGETPRADGRHGLDVVATLEALGRSMAEDGSSQAVRYPDRAGQDAA